MVGRALMGLLVAGSALSSASLAGAGIPDLDHSTAATAAGGTRVSVYCLPDGGGHGIDDCYLFGGGKTDATITVSLLDSGMQPIFNYPFEDLWIDTSLGGLVYCPAGTVADANTDVNGQTTWSNPLFAGASSDPTSGEVTRVIVNGDPLNGPGLDIQMNSPDVNGDLEVNLTDVVLFAQVYYGVYAYAADYYWDGVVNLSDIVLLAQGMGATCP